mmetsp:Transcript_39366/g.37833  ORF Transcript_39366/g.37833 Transcript_39366/m.37833 type:complete len:293 (-) Transcript_39366:1905-2783(-)
MDDELAEDGGALVGEPAVPQDEAGEVGELVDAEVAGQGGLLPLLPHDPDAAVRLLDHPHIVPAISHRRRPLLGEEVDLSHDQGLLGGAAPTHADARRLRRHAEELLLQFRGAQNDLQRRPVDHQQGIRLVLKLLQPQLHFMSVPQVPHEEELLGLALEAGAGGDAGGGLDLVPCEHPHLDPCLPERLDGLLHVVLQLVLHPCHSQQLHSLLQVVDGALDHLVAVDHVGLGGLVPFVPLQEGGLLQALLRDHQSPQSLFCQVVTGFINADPLVGPHFILHDHFRPFQVEDDPP